MTPNAQLAIVALSLLLSLALIVIWVQFGAAKSLKLKLGLAEAHVLELQEQLRSVGLRRDKSGKLRSSYVERDHED